MRIGFLVIIWMLFVVFIPLSSCRILFEDSFKEVYNLGDQITANFSIEKLKDSGDYVKAFLVCGKESLIYKKYQEIKNNEKKYFSFEFPVSIEENCRLRVEYDNETINSQIFEVTMDIDLSYSLNNKIFFPLEEIFINGSAKKRNGDFLDGLVNVYIEELVNKTIEVRQGNFSLSFVIKKEAPPKKYKLEVSAIEKNKEEEIINYGLLEEEIEVRPRPNSIYIEIKESIKPPLNVSIRAALLDQVGGLVKNESVIIKISNTLEDIVFEGSLESNESLIYFFKENSTRGGWYVNAYYGNVHSIKPIYIEENKQIEMSILKDGGSFIQIKNIGNMAYEGVIKVFIENSSYSEEIPINVNLSLEESFLYPLSFEGYYNLSASDGILEEEFQEVYLSGITGAAVGLNKKGNYWFLFILILGIIVYVSYKRGSFVALKEKFSKKAEKEKETERFAEREKKAYMVVFKIQDSFEELEKIVRKYNLSLNKIREGIYFVLFYSYPEKNSEELVFQMSNEVRRRSIEKGIRFSIAINSDKFEDKLSFLKDFSLTTRNLVNFVDGNIIVVDKVFEKLNVSTTRLPKSFKVGEQFFKAYIL